MKLNHPHLYSVFLLNTVIINLSLATDVGHADKFNNLNTRDGDILTPHKVEGHRRRQQHYKARDDPFAYALDNELDSRNSINNLNKSEENSKQVLESKKLSRVSDVPIKETLYTTTNVPSPITADYFTLAGANLSAIQIQKRITVSSHKTKESLEIIAAPKTEQFLTNTKSFTGSTLESQTVTLSHLFKTTFKPFATQGGVPNRVKGKPLIMCMPDGIMFFAQTYFDFYGRVYARGRETNSKCVYTLSGTTSINSTFAYEECGIPVSAKTGDANYQVEVIVSYEKENRIQSFLTHCLSQKLRYATEELPKRIEEALEELKIIPIKIESRAPMPQCTMRVVEEVVETENHKYGPSNGSTVHDAYIGQTLKMEFSLNPSSAAFGFLVKNCTVLDKVSGERYVIIDNKGCSTDINIFAHPHYDTYHDLALVHWHAFRIPDNAILSFQCDCVVCSDIVDDDGQNGCDLIPTPPVCPEVVTSAALQNALLFDFNDNQIFLAQKRSLQNYDVNTSVCLSEKVETCPKEVAINNYDVAKPVQVSINSHVYCLSPIFFSVILSFSLLLFLISLTCYFVCTIRQVMLKRLCASADSIDNVSSLSSIQRVFDDRSSSVIVESSFTAKN